MRKINLDYYEDSELLLHNGISERFICKTLAFPGDSRASHHCENKIL